MPSHTEMKAKLWKDLESDRTLMLGLDGGGDSHTQPMTAQRDPDAGDSDGPIWFFTSKEADLVRSLGDGAPAVAHFVSKGHDLFASLTGRLVPDNDRATIDRLWNKWVAAWFEGGKDDPKLQLIRFDPEDAQIWLNENSLFAGVKMLLGRDPKEDYSDKVAEVRIN